MFTNHLQVTLPALPLHQSGLLLTDIAQPAISAHIATMIKPDLITASPAPGRYSSRVPVSLISLPYLS